MVLKAETRKMTTKRGMSNIRMKMMKTVKWMLMMKVEMVIKVSITKTLSDDGERCSRS